MTIISQKPTKEAGTITEPECLAPCDTGTEVHLSGIIWHESESGKFLQVLSIGSRPPGGPLEDFFLFISRAFFFDC